MAPVNLPKTDVVVIGLGAAGGLAVLPLARAGLKMLGLGNLAFLATLPFRGRRK